MARGDVVKAEILSKLKECFPNAFMDNKVMRIPLKENGDIIEIKVALTAAKDILGNATVDAPTEAPKPAGKILEGASKEEVEHASKLIEMLTKLP